MKKGTVIKVGNHEGEVVGFNKTRVCLRLLGGRQVDLPNPEFGASNKPAPAKPQAVEKIPAPLPKKPTPPSKG